MDVFTGDLIVNRYTKFLETRMAPYSRWAPKDTSFYRPYVSVAKPLDQCLFVMTQLDKALNPFAVDVWGQPINPFDPYETFEFKYARDYWADDHGQTFDGYAVVLDEEPESVIHNSQEYWIVAGIHLDCVTVTGRDIKFSTEFESAKFSLKEPLHGVCPNKRDAYWFGLSSEPISGGSNGSVTISSYNQIIPIALESGDEVFPLPVDAEKIINNILRG